MSLALIVCPSQFSVPIIPNFLYATEFKGISAPLYLGSTTVSQHVLTSPTYSTIFSFFDNNTVAIEESAPNGTAWTDDNTGTIPPPVTGAIPAQQNNCLQGTEFLEEENIRVGVLFASKALMQLLVNPFVGPLTNRYLNGYSALHGTHWLRSKRMIG